MAFTGSLQPCCHFKPPIVCRPQRNAEGCGVGTVGTAPCVTVNGRAGITVLLIEEPKRRAENKESGPSLLSPAVANQAQTAFGIVLAVSFLKK